MINFIDNRLAASYFVFALAAVIGLLQLVAAHRNLVGLSLVPGARRRPLGYVLGLALMIGSFPTFFITQNSAIFKPGPAGLELLILFSGAASAGLMMSFVGASLAQRAKGEFFREAEGLLSGVQTEELTVAEGKATLYLPNTSAPWPALCAIWDPDSPADSLVQLAEALVHVGYAVLVANPDRQTAWRYPEALAMAPTACALLARRDDIAGDRIGLLGYSIGADLVLRSGSTDDQVNVVVALAPLLDRGNALAGLGALKEMTLPQAMSWARFHSYAGLVEQLAPLEHGARVNEGTDLLVIYGAEDGLIDVQRALAVARESLPSAHLESMVGEGHSSLLQSEATAEVIRRWLTGRL